MSDKYPPPGSCQFVASRTPGGCQRTSRPPVIRMVQAMSMDAYSSRHKTLQHCTTLIIEPLTLHSNLEHPRKRLHIRGIPIFGNRAIKLSALIARGKCEGEARPQAQASPGRSEPYRPRRWPSESRSSPWEGGTGKLRAALRGTPASL